MSSERRGWSEALRKVSAFGFLPGVFWSGGRGDVSNKTLQPTAAAASVGDGDWRMICQDCIWKSGSAAVAELGR